LRCLVTGFCGALMDEQGRLVVVDDQIWQGWKNQTIRLTILDYLIFIVFRTGIWKELSSKI
jgi:hypothetical protein